MKSKHFKKRAFTVVELLVVLGIVGVLIVALMVGVNKKDVVREPAPNNVENVIVNNENQDNNVLNLAGHTHNYNQKKVDVKYLASSATCTAKAKYYYSCSCGQASPSRKFEHGDKADHDYSSFVIDDRYLASEATCLFGATYYYTCTMCGTTGEELFVYGVPDKDNHVGDTKVTYVRKDGSSHTKYVVCDACNESISTSVEPHRYDAQGTCFDCSQHTHNYNQMNTADTYLRTGGTCSTAPTYYHSCECGAMGTTYFSYGGPVPHAYGDTSTAYLKEVANCGSKAVYYKTCTFCGIKGADTFTIGEKDYTNHVGGTAMDYIKYDDDKHLANTVCATCRAIFNSQEEGHRLGVDRTCKDCSTHVHNFVFYRAEIGAMKQEATCYSPAVYYVTCTCGEGGTETFTHGGTVAHDYAKVEDDAYLIRPGSCTEKALYRMSCRFGCGDTIETTFYADKVDEFNHYGNLIYGGTKDFHKLWDCCFRAASVDHEFVETLEQAATCNYWGSTRYTCDCGYTFVDQNIPFNPNNHTGTIVAGNGDEAAHRKYSCCNAPVNEDHIYNKEVVDDKYFASYATCAAPKQYYKSCECGYTNKSATFGVGEKNAQNHVEGRVNGGQKDVHKTCAGCGVTMESGSAHKYTITSPPTATCITQATNLYVCDCGYSYESTELSLNPSKHVGDIVFVGNENEHTMCTACERIVGDKTAHTFVESVYIEPTCTTMGTTKYTCECEYFYTEENIPALGHTPKDRPDWNSDHTVATISCTRTGCEQTWSNTTTEQTLREPSCGTTRQYNHSVRIEVDGQWQTFVCGVAHEGSALGHEPAGTPVWNADHTIATVKCSRDGCTASWSGNATVNVTNEATCINKYVYNHTATIVVNGVTKNFGCGTTHTEPELGHIFGDAATCTEAQMCLRPGCGMVASNPLGHRLSNPTWNTAHTKVTVTCTRSGCGEKWTGTPTKQYYVVPSCTVAEEYTHSVTMVINGDEKIYTCQGYHYGSALGHAPGSPIWTGANCQTVAVRCTRDGCPSIWSGESTERTVENATCVTTRKYEHVATFNVNGVSKTYKCTKDHSGSALGHLYTSDPTYLWNAGHLSCTAQIECKRSGCNYVLTETAEGVKSVKRKATCTTTGQYNYYVTFAHIEFEKQVCPDWHTEDAIGHAYTEETIADKYFASAQTCDLPTLYYKNCIHAGCDAKGTATFGVGDPLGHKYDKKDVSPGYMKSAATCTNKAVYYYRCSNKDCRVRGSNTYEYGSPLGHDFTKKDATSTYLAKAATCLEPSYYYYRCARENCTAHNNERYSSGKALGHDFTERKQTDTYFRAAANCNYGKTYWYKCCRCDVASDKSTYEVGEALGHLPNRTAASCTEDKVCTRSGCGAILQLHFGHNQGGLEASCKYAVYCVNCGDMVVKQLDHNSDGNPSNHYCTSKYHESSFGQWWDMTFSWTGMHHAKEYCIYCGTMTFEGAEAHVFDTPYVAWTGEVFDNIICGQCDMNPMTDY